MEVNVNFRSQLIIKYLAGLIENGYKAEFIREFDRNLPTIKKMISDKTDKQVLSQIQDIIIERKSLMTKEKKSEGAKLSA